MIRSFVVAVDGPAASGKGTVATWLGRELGLPVLDTGLLYRAVGILTDRAGDSPDDATAATAVAGQLSADQLDDPGLRTRAADYAEAGEPCSCGRGLPVNWPAG